MYNSHKISKLSSDNKYSYYVLSSLRSKPHYIIEYSLVYIIEFNVIYKHNYNLRSIYTYLYSRVLYFCSEWGNYWYIMYTYNGYKLKYNIYAENCALIISIRSYYSLITIDKLILRLLYPISMYINV